jgi:hypothetical protein
MLIEIRSNQFRTKRVAFHKGLNVVLGDENATNSIGKSTLLMIIDFAFGGGSLLEHNKDLTQELGHHDYFFTFAFGDELYRFRRGTYEPDLVYSCNDIYEPELSMELEEYTAFLRGAYGITIEDITFRALVGLYIRVWGKDNLNVYKPLHAVQNQSPKECVDNLIKTFGRYGTIKEVAQALRSKESEASALRAAFRKQIVPRIGAREHRDNQTKIADMQREIEDIKVNLAKYATNISEIVNRAMLDLKVEKDRLLATRLRLESQLERVQRNIANNRHIQSRHFAGLVRFFPNINQDRLASIEEFHSGVARLLRAELQESQRELKDQLTRINEEIAAIDTKMSETLRTVDRPSHVVDRVYELATSLRNASLANKHFEDNEALSREIDVLAEHLSREKGAVIGYIQNSLNDGLRRIVTSVFGPHRKSPTIRLTENNYSYDVFEDTGTGTAYANLIVFDLTVFAATMLPVIVHDSILFKNIENDSVANLFKIYIELDKQSFVSIDEIDKYGADTAAALRKLSVIQLDDRNVLYIKDWRKKLP